MFRLFYLLFIFFIFSVFASNNIYKKFLDEKEPGALFNGCVNLITGNLIVEDTIDAKDAIDLNKRYSSLNNFDLLKREEKDHLEFILAGFSYVGISRAFFYGDRVDILEKTGEILSFDAPYTKKKKAKDETKILNYKDSRYLAKFFYQKDLKAQHPSKIKVEMRSLLDLYVLYPNGEEKHFKRGNVHSKEYLLRSEKLLNQKVINYFYDDFNNLVEIKVLNLSMDKTYFWVKFHYKNPEKKYNDKSKDKHDVKIETSDGKNFELLFKDYYPLISNKDKAKHPFYIIESIISENSQNYTYHLGYKKTHPLLKTAKINDKELEIDYYLLGNKNPETNVVFYDSADPRFERVKFLQEKNPLGVCNESYKFYYDTGVLNQKAGSTRVED